MNERTASRRGLLNEERERGEREREGERETVIVFLKWHNLTSVDNLNDYERDKTAKLTKVQHEGRCELWFTIMISRNERMLQERRKRGREEKRGAWISLIHPSSHARCSPGKIQHDSPNETVRGEVLMEVEGESPDSELEF